MDTDTTWPPNSPHAALLGSPSGRRKLLDYRRNRGNLESPVRRLATSQNLMHMAKSDPNNVEEGEEEDEETLQLQLAAIEAKLKLKKLQQNKAKSKDAEMGGIGPESSRPSSAVSSYSNVMSRAHESQLHSIPQPNRNIVEIPLSPKKQQNPQYEQRSPGRVLLGIDKGMTSADVSLRRARSVHTNPIKKSLDDVISHRERPSSRLSTFGSARSMPPNESGGTYSVPSFSKKMGVKSFSERMAEVRDTERSKENKREAITRSRGAGLNLNQAELDNYRLAAEEARKHSPPGSPTRDLHETDFRREDILRANSKVLRKSRTLPDLRRSPSRSIIANQNESTHKNISPSKMKFDSTLYEPFSHLNLSSRILPDSFLKRTLPIETFTSMRIPDLLKQVTSPAYELPDSIIDFVVFGIIASKSSPIDHKIGPGASKAKGKNDGEEKWEDGSQNERKFMVFQLTDLKWSIDLYLFGTAVPRYHRLSPGTLVAILNPSIMPPKKGKEDTGAFSLTLHNNNDTVLEIGTSRDLGFCSAVKKDGKECGTWVNSSKSEICEFHLNLQVSKAQSGRMGVNAGSNGFNGRGTANRNKYSSFATGPRKTEDGECRGLLPRREGPRYDRNTGNHFYIASSSTGANIHGAGAPVYHPDRVTARMLDQEDDDPFIAEGQLSRDKEARLRKRLATQAKELDITKKLVALGPGGAGGDYLRHRSEKMDGTTVSETGSQRSAMVNRNAILNSEGNAYGNKKRTAESVRLSPVKKTRFVTEKGIREAGRESLGANGHQDDDDELDIV